MDLYLEPEMEHQVVPNGWVRFVFERRVDVHRTMRRCEVRHVVSFAMLHERGNFYLRLMLIVGLMHLRTKNPWFAPACKEQLDLMLESVEDTNEYGFLHWQVRVYHKYPVEWDMAFERYAELRYLRGRGLVTVFLEDHFCTDPLNDVLACRENRRPNTAFNGPDALRILFARMMEWRGQ